jgi:hypothetical protein
MAIVARNEINGTHPRYMDRGELAKTDLEALAERTARELLGVSAVDAFSMLDRGDLDGKAAEWHLRALERLIDAA